MHLKCIYRDPSTGEVIEAKVEYTEGRRDAPTPSPGFARDARAVLASARLVAPRS